MEWDWGKEERQMCMKENKREPQKVKDERVAE